MHKGQLVVIYIAVNEQPLAHLLVEAAYQAGAARVIIKWQDDFSHKAFLQHASEKELKQVPDYIKAQDEYIANHKAARIAVMSGDPQAFKEVNDKRQADFTQAQAKNLGKVRKATENNDLNWTVVAAADKAWAKTVFPKLSERAAVEKLWQEIFKTTRVDQDDPVKAWQQHEKKLQQKADWLNQEHFKALQYHSPKTNLTIGLPKKHQWVAAGAQTPEKIKFIANMPTEEVFTAPDNQNINGVVTSTKPLSYDGKVLKDMQFTFKNGQVVKATAQQGQAILDKLLQVPGAKSLGEVSLVPDNSPISNANIIFYNTLFDENASDHLALGAAYPFTIVGGEKMNEQQLEKNKLNHSAAHVDFMVGSPDMDIDGIKADGTKVPVFRQGNWI